MTATRASTISAKRRALALFRNKQYAAAGKQLAELCQKDPGDGEAWLLQGLCAQNLGRLDHAIPLLERAVALEPASARFHNALGNAWLQCRHVDRAVATFRRAVQCSSVMTTPRRVQCWARRCWPAATFMRLSELAGPLFR